MKNRNKNNTSGTLLFVGGIVAGAAAAYYLNTPKGKQLRQDAYDKSTKLKADITTKAEDISKRAQLQAENIIQTAGEKLTTLKENTYAKAAEVSELTEKKLGDFEKGVQKAKVKLSNSN